VGDDDGPISPSSSPTAVPTSDEKVDYRKPFSHLLFPLIVHDNPIIADVADAADHTTRVNKG